MHTAYDRKDNKEPASITSLAVSKDHRTLYVGQYFNPLPFTANINEHFAGDARGRVFSWSVTEQPGRGMADHWLKDEGTDQCVGCRVKFTHFERKHHCRFDTISKINIHQNLKNKFNSRSCGLLYCSKCSRFESEISRLRILKPVRVCQTCYTQLKNPASLDQ